jgi:predicted nucleic acid-binding protein
MWRVYLDTCCLNRPFDDPRSDRVRLEAAAMLIVLARIGTGDWQWIASEVLSYEVEQAPDSARRFQIQSLLQDASQVVLVEQAEIDRGEQLESLGFHDYDALHLACAESGAADVFLTTDDRLLRRASRYSAEIGVRVANPLDWLSEVTRE